MTAAGMHRIRLRDPWSAQWSPMSAESAGRQVVYSRNFNRPSGLGAQSNVWLLVRLLDDGLPPPTMMLNNRSCQLDPFEPSTLRAGVNAVLESHNRLELRLWLPAGVVEGASDPPGASQLFSVVLGIED